MHGMYLNSCLYSGLWAARSAFSSVVTIRGYLILSEHPLVSQYFRDIIWDILILLRHYDNMDFNDEALVKKTVMLVIILGARRKQALFTSSTDNIIF